MRERDEQADAGDSGGNTSGSSIAVTTSELPRKRLVAIRYAVGVPSRSTSALRDQCRLRADDQGIVDDRVRELPHQGHRRNVREDRDDRKRRGNRARRRVAARAIAKNRDRLHPVCAVAGTVRAERRLRASSRAASSDIRGRRARCLPAVTTRDPVRHFGTRPDGSRSTVTFLRCAHPLRRRIPHRLLPARPWRGVADVGLAADDVVEHVRHLHGLQYLQRVCADRNGRPAITSPMSGLRRSVTEWMRRGVVARDDQHETCLRQHVGPRRQGLSQSCSGNVKFAEAKMSAGAPCVICAASVFEPPNE